MIIHDTFPQYSDEWKSIRREKLTGSNLGAWVVEEPKIRLEKKHLQAILKDNDVAYTAKATNDDLAHLVFVFAHGAEKYLSLSASARSARETLINQKLSELGGEELPDFDSYATKRGKMLEPEARALFAKLMEEEVEEVGFIEHDSGVFGCSPDGLIKGRTEGLEIKCPLPATHIRYLREGVLPDDYKYQVHGSLAASGLEAWWFMSYAPGLPPLIVKVERSELTERVLAGCLSWGEDYRKAKAEMADMWEEWKQAV